MDIQEKIAYFAPEIAKISDKELQEALTIFLTEEVPEYFWTTPASSSGRFHPAISLGEGGLIRHTKAVTQIAIELAEFYSDGKPHPSFTNTVIVASILHDSFKYGLTGSDTKEGVTAFKNHGQVAGTAWENFCYRYDYVFLNPIAEAIGGHMTKWGGMTHITRMKSNTAKIVATADYIASRRFLDFPELHEKN